MKKIHVENLKINYKTLEQFEDFQVDGLQELSMLKELQSNLVENNLDSPFYGIYSGDELIARMSLYKVDEKYDTFFDPPQDYLELWKLEVSPEYRRNGCGSALVDFAKSHQLPIRTNPRIKSLSFWKRSGFETPKENVNRDFDNNPLVWLPSKININKAM